MTDASWGNLGAKVKRNTRINTVPAIIGDETGAIYHPYLPGYVWVRQMYASGYGKAFPVLGPAGNSIMLNPGTRVGLAQTSDNKLKVEGLDVIGGSIDGTNLYQPNVPQLPSGTFVAQQSFVTALVTPQQIPDLTVTIKSWIVIANAAYHEFPGVQSFDISAQVPSSGNNRFAVIFLDNDYLTPRVTASTARANTDLPLGAADIQECITAAPTTSTPLAAIRLYGGQTQILNSDIIHDLRQMINTSAISTSAPAFLNPCKFAASTNITISSPGATIDSGSPSAGDPILLTGQSSGSQNGPWIWNGAAVPLTRPSWFASGSTVQAFQNQWVYVSGGATYSATIWTLGNSGTVTIDTTSQTWNLMSFNGLMEGGAVILAPASSARNVVQPTGDFNNLILRGSVGQTSKLLSLQNSGSTEVFGVGVGGGTTAAGAITSNAGLILSNKDGGNAVLENKAFGTGSAAYVLGLVARGTQASPTATQDADNLMVFGGRGYPNTSFDSGVLSFKAVGTHSGSAAGASLSIFTTPSGTLAQQQSLLISDVGLITQLAINATTNAVDDLILANHRSTGTPAAGFGSAVRFIGQSSTTNDRNMGRVFTQWNSATDASRTADLYGSASDSGGDRNGWRVRADGTGAIFDILGGLRVPPRVVTAAGAITATNQDVVIEVNKTVGAATTVNLPAGVSGQTMFIKDGKGDANTNNITLTPAAGNIDNAATYVINVAKGGACIHYDGTQWIVLCKI